MKTPDKIIIDLENDKVLLETSTTVTVCDGVSKMSYCQNSSKEGIEISINVKIPFEKIHKEGVDEQEIHRVIQQTVQNLARPTGIDITEEDDRPIVNYKEIESMFKEMLRLPGDDKTATEFIRFNVDGFDSEIYDFKRDLFKASMKDPKIIGEKREWLKRNKIRLFNSKKKLDI